MRILFTTHTMPSHYYPLEPLARAARAGGHTVAFATGRGLAQPIREAGFTFFEAGLNPDDAEVMAAVRSTFSRPRSEHGDLVFTELFGGILAQRLIPGLEQAFEQFRPDVVVSEMTELVGRTLAERYQLPSALVLFGLLPRPQQLAGALKVAHANVRRDLGLGAEDALASHTRALKLVYAARSYQWPNSVVSDRERFYKPSHIAPARANALPEWVTQLSGKPIVYGTLGTVPEFNARPGALRALIDAIGSCDVHGVVTCGFNQAPDSIGPLPPNVRVERFIPQAALLERCSAIVQHGGYGTTVGALSFGVPMVVTPMGADQPEHAQRCQELAIAEVVWPESFAADEIARALQKVLSQPSFAENARKQGAELANLPDTATALADLVAWTQSAQSSQTSVQQAPSAVAV